MITSPFSIARYMNQLYDTKTKYSNNKHFEIDEEELRTGKLANESITKQLHKIAEIDMLNNILFLLKKKQYKSATVLLQQYIIEIGKKIS